MQGVHLDNRPPCVISFIFPLLRNFQNLERLNVRRSIFNEQQSGHDTTSILLAGHDPFAEM